MLLEGPEAWLDSISFHLLFVLFSASLLGLPRVSSTLLHMHIPGRQRMRLPLHATRNLTFTLVRLLLPHS